MFEHAISPAIGLILNSQVIMWLWLTYLQSLKHFNLVMLTYKTKNFIKQSHAAVIIAGCLPTNSFLGLTGFLPT